MWAVTDKFTSISKHASENSTSRKLQRRSEKCKTQDMLSRRTLLQPDLTTRAVSTCHATPNSNQRVDSRTRCRLEIHVNLESVSAAINDARSQRSLPNPTLNSLSIPSNSTRPPIQSMGILGILDEPMFYTDERFQYFNQ